MYSLCRGGETAYAQICVPVTARLCGWHPSLESISGVNKLTANPVGLRTHKRIICRGGETAYALVSGTSDRKVVWVQIPSSAPNDPYGSFLFT